MPGERHEAAEGPEAGEPREQGDAERGEGSRGSAESERPETPAPAEEEDRRSRPDIRAARAETRLRRWALLLLVLVPVVYFLYQHFS